MQTIALHRALVNTHPVKGEPNVSTIIDGMKPAKHAPAKAFTRIFRDHMVNVTDRPAGIFDSGDPRSDSSGTRRAIARMTPGNCRSHKRVLANECPTLLFSRFETRICLLTMRLKQQRNACEVTR